MKVHHLGNVNTVLQTLRENKVFFILILLFFKKSFNVYYLKKKIRITNISANDIVDGNPKLTLGLVWSIIQHWQVRDVLRTAVYDIHTTNLEKALLTWCQNSTKKFDFLIRTPKIKILF